MGRLEDVIRRNQNKGKPRERIVVMVGFSLFLLLIIFLMLFTDLGLPKDPEPQKPATRVDGVQLRSPTPRDARPAD